MKSVREKMQAPLINKIIREPMLHFLLIGVILFAIFAYRNEPLPDSQTASIIIDESRVENLRAAFEGVWRRPPTQAEMDGLIEDFIREEVFYREALELGLDRNDAIVRRRLRQKMEFLTDSAASALQPNQEQLASYLAENIQDFTSSPRIAFDQVFLGNVESAGLIEESLILLQDGSSPEDVGLPTLLPTSLPLSTPSGVDGVFGAGFFDQLSQFGTEEWEGPVASSYGTHLVRLRDREIAEPPQLDEVESRVSAAWRQEAAQRLREDAFESLRGNYEIVLKTGTTGATQ